MNDEERYKELDNYMRKNNLTLEGYLKILQKKNTPLLNLSDEAYREYVQYFDYLKKDIDKYESVGKHLFTVQERGQLLEKMTGILFFSGNAVFDKVINCRTATNEIDILVNWTKEAVQIGIDRAYSFMGENFLCECKNYIKRIDVTYVGKFYSLMKVSDVKFGIIFSKEGISGKNIWVSGKGLARKIALRERIYIIDITWNDFKSIYNKETNIMTIINNKYIAIKNDINYDKYISRHEMEQKIKEKLKNIKD